MDSLHVSPVVGLQACLHLVRVASRRVNHRAVSRRLSLVRSRRVGQVGSLHLNQVCNRQVFLHLSRVRNLHHGRVVNLQVFQLVYQR